LKIPIGKIELAHGRERKGKRAWGKDCAHVKSALPFHIRENLTRQGFWRNKSQTMYDEGQMGGGGKEAQNF